MGVLRRCLLVATLLCLAATSRAAAIIAYFNNPLLPGDTQTSYPGAYGLLSSSFSLEQSINIGTGAGGAGAGKAVAQDLTFTKRGDVSSPSFELLQLRGTVLPKVIISMVKSADPPVPFFNLTLSNVHITSNQFSMGDGDIEVISISLNYAALKATYYDYNNRGVATQQTFSWDFAANRQT